MEHLHSAMISSRDVNGTNVYSPTGEKLGHVSELLIDKASGRVGYAVMAFGGFLGLGEEEYPLPWGKLHYDVAQEGYVTDVTRDQLENAPPRVESWRSDREWERGYHSYYGLPPYWI